MEANVFLGLGTVVLPSKVEHKLVIWRFQINFNGLTLFLCDSCQDRIRTLVFEPQKLRNRFGQLRKKKG